MIQKLIIALLLLSIATAYPYTQRVGEVGDTLQVNVVQTDSLHYMLSIGDSIKFIAPVTLVDSVLQVKGNIIVGGDIPGFQADSDTSSWDATAYDLTTGLALKLDKAAFDDSIRATFSKVIYVQPGDSIQAAFTSLTDLSATQYGAVVLLPGTHTITATVEMKKYSALLGYGCDISILNATTNITMVESDSSCVSISGLTINNSTTTHDVPSISINVTYDAGAAILPFEIRNCRIVNVNMGDGGYGIFVSGSLLYSNYLCSGGGIYDVIIYNSNQSDFAGCGLGIYYVGGSLYTTTNYTFHIQNLVTERCFRGISFDSFQSSYISLRDNYCVSVLNLSYALYTEYTVGPAALATTLYVDGGRYKGGAGDIYLKGKPSFTTTANLNINGDTGVTLGGDAVVNYAGIDGEHLINDSVDDDALDFTDITLADFTDDVGYMLMTAFDDSIGNYDLVYLDALTDSLDSRAAYYLFRTAFDDSLAAYDLMYRVEFADSIASYNLLSIAAYTDSMNAREGDYLFKATFDDSLSNYDLLYRTEFQDSILAYDLLPRTEFADSIASYDLVYNADLTDSLNARAAYYLFRTAFADSLAAHTEVLVKSDTTALVATQYDLATGLALKLDKTAFDDSLAAHTEILTESDTTALLATQYDISSLLPKADVGDSIAIYIATKQDDSDTTTWDATAYDLTTGLALKLDKTAFDDSLAAYDLLYRDEFADSIAVYSAEYMLRDGSVPWTGNQQLGSTYISSDGGSEGIQVDASGNVIMSAYLGVGVTPDEAIHTQGDMAGSDVSVKVENVGHSGSAAVQLWSLGDGYGEIRFVDSTTAKIMSRILYDHTSDALSFRTNEVDDRLTIDVNGNVGINDATPSYRLDVNGRARFTGIVTADSGIVGVQADLDTTTFDATKYDLAVAVDSLLSKSAFPDSFAAHLTDYLDVDDFADSLAAHGEVLVESDTTALVATQYAISSKLDKVAFADSLNANDTPFFYKDGSRAMTGSIQLGANRLTNDGTAGDGLAISTAGDIAIGANKISNDGDDEGIAIDAAGSIGVGTTTMSAKFNARSYGQAGAGYFYTTGNASTGVTSLAEDLIITPIENMTVNQDFIGLYCTATIANTAYTLFANTQLRSFLMSAEYAGSQTLPMAWGGLFTYKNSGAGVTTTATALQLQLSNTGAGSITTGTFLNLPAPTISAGSIGTIKAIDMNVASGTNRWNLYATGTAANYLAGTLGVGRTPATGLSLRAAQTGSWDGVLAIEGTNAYNAGAGAEISFGGKYNSSAAYANYAQIAGLKNDAVDGDYGGKLVFRTRQNSGGGGAYGDRMIIDRAGNVGIAMTPVRTLDVTGTFGVTGISTLGGYVNIGANRLTNDGTAGDGITISAAGDIGIGNNKISNDGDDEGISITTAGAVATSSTLTVGGSLMLGANNISNDGTAGDGLTFGASGSTIFGKNAQFGTNYFSYDGSNEGLSFYSSGNELVFNQGAYSYNDFYIKNGTRANLHMWDSGAAANKKRYNIGMEEGTFWIQSVLDDGTDPGGGGYVWRVTKAADGDVEKQYWDLEENTYLKLTTTALTIAQEDSLVVSGNTKLDGTTYLDSTVTIANDNLVITNGYATINGSTFWGRKTNRTDVAAPTESDMVYDNTTHKMYCWDGSAWQALW